MPLDYFRHRPQSEVPRVEPRLDSLPAWKSRVFDSGHKIIVDRAHVKVERLDTQPVVFSKVFKEFEDLHGQKYDYRYWAERENFILREFMRKRTEFTHVVQPRHLISENDAAKQVLTYDAGITVADWLRVKSRYGDTPTLAHPFQRRDAFLHLLRACLVALKEIHAHRIVHCDIKEDNICIPYGPHPWLGPGAPVNIDFSRLRIIDFAFSVAHAMPLTQVLVINPDEQLPYQSELLIAALRADRRSGCPDAVQQLDYRVDLFSLGQMAGKIMSSDIYCPAVLDPRRELHDIRELVETLKAFGTAAENRDLPHDRLITTVDSLLARAPVTDQAFRAGGEWTDEEMAQLSGSGRVTPMTPVAMPLPTPIAAPLAAMTAPALPHHKRTAWRAALAVFCAITAASALLYGFAGKSVVGHRAVPNSSVAAPREISEPAKVAAKAAESVADHTRADLRAADDGIFQAAFRRLNGLAANDGGAANAGQTIAEIESLMREYGAALTTSASYAERRRAFTRLAWIASAGNAAAAQRVAEFEHQYDAVKATLARSTWWLQGQGAQPPLAARWLENGRLLAEHGDRPAMLDVAYALGHGRGLEQDRPASVQIYMDVAARSGGNDPTSAVIRQSALRGLTVMLDTIVAQKDSDAAGRILPPLESSARSGAAAAQYYAGLVNECALHPANFPSARQWYRLAGADPDWKKSADRRLRLLGHGCPAAA